MTQGNKNVQAIVYEVVFRVGFLSWSKIWFLELVQTLGCVAPFPFSSCPTCDPLPAFRTHYLGEEEESVA